jgi:hypothetical protein
MPNGKESSHKNSCLPSPSINAPELISGYVTSIKVENGLRLVLRHKNQSLKSLWKVSSA